MLGVYGWAFMKPVRKLYYNMTITLVSVVVALVVGGIEVLGLFAGHFHFSGMLWDTVRTLNDNFGTLGYFIIGFFVLSWILSIAFYKWQRLDELWGKPHELRHRHQAAQEIQGKPFLFLFL